MNRAGQVWLLTFNGNEAIILVLGGEKAHGNGRDTLHRSLVLYCDNLSGAGVAVGEVDWWSSKWFGPTADGCYSERIA